MAADDFFISLDNDFHRLLYHDSGYDRIWEAMHNVTSHMDRVRYLDSALCRGNIASVQKEHEQIFGYLRDGLPLDVDVEALFEHHLGDVPREFPEDIGTVPGFLCTDINQKEYPLLTLTRPWQGVLFGSIRIRLYAGLRISIYDGSVSDGFCTRNATFSVQNPEKQQFVLLNCPKSLQECRFLW